MGFRINTNIAAMNAHRNSSMTNLGLDKSLNSLSSGLRINKAADDASGMAIADSLRQQSQGLGQAVANANDGIGVTQTADGALDEYINIANTIRTKAIQAASDGQNLQSRTAIQADIDRLMEEAQNIASTTSFNGQSLLNGAFQNKSFHIGAYSGETVKISIEDTQTAKVGDDFAMTSSTSAATSADTVGFGDTSSAAAAGTAQLKVSVMKPGDTTVTEVDSGSVTITKGEHAGYEVAQQVVDAFNAQAQEDNVDVRASVYETSSSTSAAPSFAIRVNSATDLSAMSITETVADGKAAAIQAAATAGATNNFSKIDVTTKDGAEQAIITSDYALRDLDKTRSDLGSVQNQLAMSQANAVQQNVMRLLQ
jgi:flagellin